MLTRQGWLVGAGALALFLAGRVLAAFELYVMGTAAVALLALAMVNVWMTRLNLEVGRQVHPPRVHAGTPSRVELRVRNLARRPSPVLRLHDPVSGTRGADLLVGPVGSGAASGVAYRLPTEKRGILHVGPLQVVVSDPFGLASVSTPAAEPTDLTVFPRIDDIAPLPLATGDDPHAGADHPNALGRTGEDFYALRPYVVGDDLRRVHWRSTARHDQLMVRQDELPWQGRTTVVLDVRKSATTPDSLELVVSAAASIVTACWNRRDLIRLLGTDGADSGFAAGHGHVEAIMEYLAIVQREPGGSLRRVVDGLRRSEGGGAVVLVLSAVPESELRAVAALGAGFTSLATVLFDPSSWSYGATPAPSAPLPGTVLRITDQVDFATAWNRVMRRRFTPATPVPAR